MKNPTTLNLMPEPKPPFPPTRWTLLRQLREGSAEDAQAALNSLCQAYWQPLYVVARQRQLPKPDAQDAVQSFFEAMLRGDTFVKADESRGKLRNLLLRAFDNHCGKQWRKDHRLKRGNGAEHIEFIDAHGAEQRYLSLTDAPGTPAEVLYNREWAHSVMQRGLESLRGDYAGRGLAGQFDLMVNRLTLAEDGRNHGELVAATGLSPGAFRTALHRMRQQFRGKIEQELATALDTFDPVLIRQEMLALFQAFD